MGIDIDALLKKVDLQLGTVAETDWIQPNRQTLVLEFLTFGKIEKWDLLNAEHYYVYDGFQRDIIPTQYKLLIVHGHVYESSCSAPYMCHLFGYWPDETMSPRFREQFNLKWKEFYHEKGWK